MPPHLRTRDLSFDRNWQISQNRINKRYPDSMPTLRKMRDDISAYARKMGMDLVSVAPLDQESEAGQLAISDAPGMRTVIAIAYKTPVEARTQYNEDTIVDAWWYGLWRKMHHTLMILARMVEDYGYNAASYTGDVPGKIADIPEKLVSMTSLGEINEDGIFVMPDFGEDVIVGAITTDALIDASTHKDAPITKAFKSSLKGKDLLFEVEKNRQR